MTSLFEIDYLPESIVMALSNISKKQDVTKRICMTDISFSASLTTPCVETIIDPALLRHFGTNIS